MNNQASRLRNIVEKIADQRINKLRPDIRVGTVFSFDRSSQTAYILFPGNDETNLVPVRFGLDRIPSSAMVDTFETDGLSASGDVVRIAGRPGAYFILDYVTGVPSSEAIDLAGVDINVAWAEEIIQVPADSTVFYHDLAYTPLEFSETLYWNELFQPRTEWRRQLRALNILDPNNLLEAGDVITYRYMYEKTDFQPELTWDVLPLVGTAGYEDITNEMNGSFALPAGVQEGDLIVVAVHSGTGPAVNNDPRLVGGPAEAGGTKCFYLGYANSVQSPLQISLGAGWPSSESNRAVSIAVYRGLIAEQVVVSTATGSQDSHPFENAQFGVVMFAANTGTVAGNSLTTASPDWVRRRIQYDYKAGSAIFDWFSKEGPIQMPVGTFTYNGTQSKSSIMTVKIRPGVQ